MLADITVTSVVIWVVCLLLAAGVAWSRYEKKRVRDKFLRELMAMDPARREKLLQRLSPKLQTEMREHLMERYRGG
jgi:cytochrome c-type biogenesis protein CcmH/NrfF